MLLAFPGCVMVAQQTLDLFVGVRILPGELGRRFRKVINTSQIEGLKIARESFPTNIRRAIRCSENPRVKRKNSMSFFLHEAPSSIG